MEFGISNRASTWPGAAGKSMRLVGIKLLTRLMVMVVTRSRMRRENVKGWEGGDPKWDWDAELGAEQDTWTCTKHGLHFVLMSREIASW